MSITDQDRETARELQTAIVRGANPIPGAKRVEAWEIIAQAIAEARDAKERAQAGFLGHDAALCRERARLTEAQARIAELTRWKADLEKVIDLKKTRIAQRDELVKELSRERDEARQNAERFRQSMYAVEQIVHERTRERDEARAEINRQQVTLNKFLGIIHAHQKTMGALATERDEARAREHEQPHQPTDATDRKPTL